MTSFLRLLTLSIFSVQLGFSQVQITEFLSSNDSGLRDEDGDRGDWIELFNSSSSPVNLDGWALTDSAQNAYKWRFPSQELAPNQHLVVFASGKDRARQLSELHTNFSLKKGGEFLQLTRPDGTAASVFSPEFPAQATDVSYGFEQSGTEEQVIRTNSLKFSAVPTSAADFGRRFVQWNDRNNLAYPNQTWSSSNAGIGYEDGFFDTYGTFLDAGGDVKDQMLDTNASVFIRIPFNLRDASAVNSLRLSMLWDDGFVAYINGVEVVSDRAPDTLSWNSTATSQRDDGLNDETTYFTISPSNLNLQNGENILAIQGLNGSASSSDMLILPELYIFSASAVGSEPVYFAQPSPGTANGEGDATLAPLFGDVTEEVPQPSFTGSTTQLLLSAEVSAASEAVASVAVEIATDFGQFRTETLLDNGLGGDLSAGDGIYSKRVTFSNVSEGSMLRWRYLATDTEGNSRTSPAFRDPADSDRYYGTVVEDSALQHSRLPVLHTFVQDTAGIDTRPGTRGSVYYLGRFYDNVQMDLHGQSTASFPKKSYDFDFNRGNRFLWKEGEQKVKDINLLTNWADKSKVRNTLAYELFADAGVSHHFAFPVRMQRNGEFFSVTDLVEDGDDRYLERLGLDGDGALYKMYDALKSAGSAVKKTRKDEGTQDLATFINQVRVQPTSQWLRNAYDHVDLAATVNYLAAYQVFNVADFGHKNYYLYRDTNGSGEWRPMVWDVDLSFGRRYDRNLLYFDDELDPRLSIFDSNNDLFKLIYDNEEFQEMFVRRFETLRRRILGASSITGGPRDLLAQKINRIMDAIDPLAAPPGQSDADLDYQRWGSWGNRNQARVEAQRIIEPYLRDARAERFRNAINLAGETVNVPFPLQGLPSITIESVEANPSSGNQEEEYIVLRNNSTDSYDLSGYQLTGGIDFTFPEGTVLLPDRSVFSNVGGRLYVAKDAGAFRSRASGPSGGQFRFVQGGYKGQLSARGETIALMTARGTVVDTFATPSQPTASQQNLRVSEVMYHPADPTAAEQAAIPGLTSSSFEYIELVNTGSQTLDLSSVTLDGGIAYSFPQGTSLQAGAYLIVAKDPAAFALRYPDVTAQVEGPFEGQLANSEDSFTVQESGENVIHVSYEDDWFPITDGGGRSLVLRDQNTAFNAFGSPETFGSSLETSGSPGSNGDGYGVHFRAYQEARFSREDREPGRPGSAEADTDGDGLTLFAEYALGTDPERAEPFATRVVLNESSAGIEFQRRRNALDVSLTLLHSSDLSSFAPVSNPQTSSLGNLTDGMERVQMMMDRPAISDQAFFRLSLDQVEAAP